MLFAGEADNAGAIFASSPSKIQVVQWKKKIEKIIEIPLT